MLILLFVLWEQNIMSSKQKSKEQIDHEKVYRDPDKIIHFMDYSNEPARENCTYILDLVPGLLQPLEIVEENDISDEVLLNLDIEAIVKEAELSTGTKHEDSVQIKQ